MRYPRALLCALLAAGTLPAAAVGAAGDDLADRVLGQIDFLHTQANFVDGRGFNNPMGVAVDRSVSPNRVYVADTNNYRVLGWSDIDAFLARRPADLVLGQETVYDTFSPPAYPRCSPLPATADTFCSPQKLAVDRAGNLYVTDFYNSRVLEFDRPFDKDRVADRVFGPPDFTTRGTDFLPYDLALDAAGNLWVAISRGGPPDRIVRFDNPLHSDPGVDGQLTPTGGCLIRGLAFDKDGRLYTDCPESSTLLVYEPPFADDEAPSRRIVGLWTQSLTVDDHGFLYWVASPCLQRARTPLGPNVGIGYCWSTEAHGEGELAVDSSGRLLLAADYVHSILVYPRSGAPAGGTPRIVGQPNTLHREESVPPDRVDLIGLSSPRAVAVDRSVTPNRLYALDAANNRVLGWQDAAGFANARPADLVIGQTSPFGFDCQAGRSGICTAIALSNGNVHASLGLAVDAHGNLYVSDTENNRVLELDSPFTTDTLPDRVYGQPSFDANACGSFKTGLCAPGPLALGPDGALFVADLLNNRVVAYRHPLDSPVQSDLVIGRPGCDKTPSPANLCFSVKTCTFPSSDYTSFVTNAGLAVDGAGNLWVSDSVRRRILMFADPLHGDQRADLALSDPAPPPGQGQPCGARVLSGMPCHPGALAFSPAGTLFAADSGLVLEIPTPHPVLPAAHVLGTEPPSPEGGVTFVASGLAFDAQGNLYLSDQTGNRVLAFDRPEL
jgi:sugar lactone lactonase YvrE